MNLHSDLLNLYINFYLCIFFLFQDMGSTSKRVPKKPTVKKSKPSKKKHIEIEYEMETENPREKAKY